MTSEFHIRPWEHELLGVWEFYGLCSAIDKLRDEANSVNDRS